MTPSPGEQPTRRTAAIVPAAGKGERLGPGAPKALRTLGGIPMLVHAVRAVASSRVVDLVVVAERPKLSPHVPAMRSRIAGILEIDPSQVGIKATTNEGMDAVGQGRALAVHAVCLLFRA